MNKITKNQLKKYQHALMNEEKSANTVKKYLRDVNAFSLWLQNRPLSKAEVLKYKEHLLAENYAPTSVNSILSSLNSFFSFAGLYQVRVKTLKIQRQIFANENRQLSKAEYQKLLNTAKQKGREQLYYIMQTVCSLGIRISELSYITKESLSAGKATIHLKGKTRIVMIPNSLRKLLLRYAKKQKIAKGSIFVTKKGVPLDRTYIWRQMKSLCGVANVPKEKVFPHNLRHLFARTYYSLQKDIVRLADILGHSSVNTTRIYTMESGELHQKQLQSLGLLML